MLRKRSQLIDWMGSEWREWSGEKGKGRLRAGDNENEGRVRTGEGTVSGRGDDGSSEEKDLSDITCKSPALAKL